MNEFSTFIFKENELKTNNVRVIKERPIYIGVAIFLFGIILDILDLEIATYVYLLAGIFMIAGQLMSAGPITSIGHRPLSVKLRKDSVVIGKEILEIKNKKDLEIICVGYKGEILNKYQSHSGNENRMIIHYMGKETEFNFVLESESHKDKLIKFCEDNGFDLTSNNNTLLRLFVAAGRW